MNPRDPVWPQGLTEGKWTTKTAFGVWPPIYKRTRYKTVEGKRHMERQAITLDPITRDWLLTSPKGRKHFEDLSDALLEAEA